MDHRLINFRFFLSIIDRFPFLKKIEIDQNRSVFWSIIRATTRVYLILVCDTRQQPCGLQDPSTRTSQIAKKARVNEARHKHLRLHESIQGEYLHLHSCSRVVSSSLSESVQLATGFSISSKRLPPFRWG